MESYYGIGVKNRYEMFYDDDSDPVELLKKTQLKKKERVTEKENKNKEKPKESPKKQEKTTNSSLPPKNQDVNLKNGGARTDKKELKKPNLEEFNNQRNTGDSNVKETKDANQRFNGEMRGRGRGGAGADRGSNSGEFARGRGSRRGRGNFSDRGGKREFDRQSGMVNSGVKSVDKKEGAGSYNWGSDKEQMNFDATQDNEVRESPDKGKEPGSETKENDLPKEEESPKEMTLDEWKALQKRDRPQFNVRKAGEGENNDQWKTTYVLNKKKAEETEEVTNGTTEAEVHQGKRKVLLPIDYQFPDSPMRGRFRGRGRGGPRGRGFRGGGGGRFAPLRPEAPKMDDEKVFPSLG